MTTVENTLTRTLWSDTLLDLLYTALAGNKADHKICTILNALSHQGFHASYLLKKVQLEVNMDAAMRLKKPLKNISSKRHGRPGSHRD